VNTAAIGRAQLVLEVNGMRHPLRPPGLVIGRGTEADLRINDPGISRRHAEIRVSGSGAVLKVDIVDLGSTNGIIVNGKRVRQSPLEVGSRIEIGTTRMLVHAPAGR
jgi:pSer/pThr/pTyr-binding forkhead associated (FHA) protein